MLLKEVNNFFEKPTRKMVGFFNSGYHIVRNVKGTWPLPISDKKKLIIYLIFTWKQRLEGITIRSRTYCNFTLLKKGR